MSFAGDDERSAQRMRDHDQGVRNWVKAVNQGTAQIWTAYANNRLAAQEHHDRTRTAGNIPAARPTSSLPSKAVRLFAIVGVTIALAHALVVQHLAGLQLLGESVVGLVLGAASGAILGAAWAIVAGLAKVILRLAVFAFWMAIACGLVWMAVSVVARG